MARRSGLLILLATSSLLLCAGNATALCIAPDTPCREYAKTPVIFQGLIQSVTTVEHDQPPFGATGGRLWRVKVEREWKGLKGAAEVELLTLGAPGKSWVEDEIDFKIGERYVIWAAPSSTSSALRAHGCSLTRLLKDATEQIEFLDSLSRPASGGYVYGTVQQLDEPATGTANRTARNVTVVLEGGGTPRETRTDNTGRFRFVGVPDGRYEVYLVLPDELATFRPTPADPRNPRNEMPIRRTVSLNGPRDCAEATFSVQSSGRLSGYAVSADGKPVTGVVVQGVLVDHLRENDERRAKGQFAYLGSAKSITDDQGYFECLNLQPGRYVVGVNLEHKADSNQPYARSFYPGSHEVDEAAVFELKPGERFHLGTFTLPPRLAPIEIRGVVVLEDGQPVADGFVSVTNNLRARLPGARIDKRGAFSLSMYPGYTYVLAVSVGSGQDALTGRAVLTLDEKSEQPLAIKIVARSPRSPR
jgi:hypothetical protein